MHNVMAQLCGNSLFHKFVLNATCGWMLLAFVFCAMGKLFFCVPYRPLSKLICGMCHSLCTCIVSVLFKTQCHGSILWKFIISHMCVEWHMLSTCDVFMCRSFFLRWCKRTVASPSTAMVDNRCPVRLQTQLAGEEESDELEDWVARDRFMDIAQRVFLLQHTAMCRWIESSSFVKTAWQNA